MWASINLRSVSRHCIVATLFCWLCGPALAETESRKPKQYLQEFDRYLMKEQAQQAADAVQPRTSDAKKTEKPNNCANPEVLEEINSRISKFVKAAAALDDIAHSGLNLSTSVSTSGESAGSQENWKAGAEIEVSSGVYPSQSRVKFGANIDSKKSDSDSQRAINEEVTSFLVNHDHYPRPWLELYGFAERFTDSFVKIDQRYEIGLGVKFEKTSGGKFGIEPKTHMAGRSIQAARLAQWITDLESEVGSIAGFEFTKSSDPSRAQEVGDDLLSKLPKCKDEPRSVCATLLQQIANCPSAYGPEGCKKVLQLITQRLAALSAEQERGKCPKSQIQYIESATSVDMGDILEAFVKEKSRVELGIAFSAFAEFEKPAALDTTVFDNSTMQPLPQKPTPEATQRFRLSVRPSLVWRIGDLVEWRSQIYFKLPIDNPRRVDTAFDYRIDGLSEFRLSLGGPSVVLGHEWHYDNVPPDRELAAALPATQYLINPNSVSKTHRLTSLKLEWKIKP